MSLRPTPKTKSEKRSEPNPAPAATAWAGREEEVWAAMGNKFARTTQASATEYYLHELPSARNFVLVEVVSRGRFLKSVRCKHDEGLLLVKVYFKRAGEPLDLKEHERRLERIRNAFEGLEGSHVWPSQVWLQTDKVAYLLRQYFYSNLHDRLSTRPFLSQIEKKWLAFQASPTFSIVVVGRLLIFTKLIHAVEQSHNKGVCHGDIKCENVLVTSWNWLYCILRTLHLLNQLTPRMMIRLIFILRHWRKAKMLSST